MVVLVLIGVIVIVVLVMVVLVLIGVIVIVGVFVVFFSFLLIPFFLYWILLVIWKVFLDLLILELCYKKLFIFPQEGQRLLRLKMICIKWKIAQGFCTFSVIFRLETISAVTSARMSAS